MNPFLARLANDETFLIDGAMGGAIEDAGIDVKNALWGSVALLSSEGLATNDAIHAAYRAAGAELVIANSHNLSLEHCRQWLHAHPERRAAPADFLAETNGRAIASARRAGGLVAGCIASPDRPYTTTATLTAEQITARLRPQFEVLVELAPDVVMFEMLTTEADVEGVANLVDDRVPVTVGLVCRADGRMRSGARIRDAVARLDGRVAAFFVQCTPMDEVDRPLDALLDAASSPVGVYANDGRVWRDGAWHGARASADRYAEAALRWCRAGATIVGGCCGTGPAHIAAIRDRIR